MNGHVLAKKYVLDEFFNFAFSYEKIFYTF